LYFWSFLPPEGHVQQYLKLLLILISYYSN